MSKPKLNLFGEENSICAVLGRASRLLRQNGQVTEADEMYFRVNSADSFEGAMQVINEYVETEVSPAKAQQSLLKEERLHSRLLDIAKHHIFPVKLRGNLEYRGDESADFLIVSVGRSTAPMQPGIHRLCFPIWTEKRRRAKTAP